MKQRLSEARFHLLFVGNEIDKTIELIGKETLAGKQLLRIKGLL